MPPPLPRPPAAVNRFAADDQQSLRLPCVTGRTEPVDGHHRLLADDPGVVAARQAGDITGPAMNSVPSSIRIASRPLTWYWKCGAWRLTAAGASDRLHIRGPAPSRLEHQPPDLPAADL